jgi:hypothetical protein
MSRPSFGIVAIVALALTAGAVPSVVSDEWQSATEGCGSVRPVIGISSTPVIDRRTGTIYVLAKTMTSRGSDVSFNTTLHALSLFTGKDRLRPVDVTGTAQLSTRGMFAPGHSWKQIVSQEVVYESVPLGRVCRQPLITAERRGT